MKYFAFPFEELNADSTQSFRISGWCRERIFLFLERWKVASLSLGVNCSAISHLRDKKQLFYSNSHTWHMRSAGPKSQRRIPSRSEESVLPRTNVLYSTNAFCSWPRPPVGDSLSFFLHKTWKPHMFVKGKN